MKVAMFEGFATHRIRTAGAEIFLRAGGQGPPLLLLHGYPQTHAIWHRVAPALAQRFTLICADLRGYGDSSKPDGGPGHVAYAKRAMAQDMVEAMTALGHERFAIAGHDRGGRVAHRLCLDHPDRVQCAAVLDIVPTRTLFAATDQALATGYYHWFFLSQPEPLPERMIGADPLFYLHSKLGQWSAGKDTRWLDPGALGRVRALLFGSSHHPCQAAKTIARRRRSISLHDDADLDRRVACPLLVLWGEKALMHRRFDVLATWREKAAGPVVGAALPCGHYLPEEQPEATLNALAQFFAG